MAKRGRKAKVADQSIGANLEYEDYLRWVAEIEDEHEKLNSLKGSYMKSCQVHQESIKRLKKMCKAEGGSVQRLNFHLMQRQHDRAEHKALGEMQPDHAKAAINDADKFRVQTDLFAGDAEDDDKAADDIAFLAAGGKTDADRLAEGISPLSH